MTGLFEKITGHGGDGGNNRLRDVPSASRAFPLESRAEKEDVPSTFVWDPPVLFRDAPPDVTVSAGGEVVRLQVLKDTLVKADCKC